MMTKRTRQIIGILAAVVAYYIVHEGAHMLVALCQGVFRQIIFMGLGVQIDVSADQMSDTHMGLFCVAGAVATFLVGWLLVLLRKKICALQSKLLKSVLWYVSLALLMLDPLYLSVLCGLFGGGDMNGIQLLVPELAARITFGAVGIVHLFVIWKYLLPSYKESFQNNCD